MSSLINRSLYKTLPQAQIAREHLKYYTSIPHLTGTNGDEVSAIYTKKRFEEYGLENVHFDLHSAYVNYPISRSVAVSIHLILVYLIIQDGVTASV